MIYFWNSIDFNHATVFLRRKNVGASTDNSYFCTHIFILYFGSTNRIEKTSPYISRFTRVRTSCCENEHYFSEENLLMAGMNICWKTSSFRVWVLGKYDFPSLIFAFPTSLFFGYGKRLLPSLVNSSFKKRILSSAKTSQRSHHMSWSRKKQLQAQ